VCDIVWVRVPGVTFIAEGDVLDHMT
jgi:hypothetical protein